MGSHFRLQWFLLGILALSIGPAAGVTGAEERTRSFPAQKCRYTLPGAEWNWIDKDVQKALFIASNSNAFGITLSATNCRAPQVSDEFMKGFESTYYQPGELRKRGGSYTTFLGLPSYQLNSSSPDGRTLVTRVFIAHGLAYHLTIIGGEEPVEDNPGLETIMRGFEFTVPPNREASGDHPQPPQGVAVSPSSVGHGGSGEGQPESLARRMGQFAEYGLSAVVAIVVVIWMIRRQKGGAPSPRASEDSNSPAPRDDTSSE
jgi:hypothetical protein